MGIRQRQVIFIVVILILQKLSDASIFNRLFNTPSRNLTLTSPQLITDHGFVVKEYKVITEDGYILSMYRIKNTGPVVFIMHGLINSSDNWLVLGSDSLPFLLAKAGYDVYLGNARGNKYSKKHKTLSPDEKEFWEFSWHEIGYYDLPAMIDVALKKSKKTKLTYIGQSQGSTVFYVMASLRPEYNKKIVLMISMATVAWIYREKSPVLRLLVKIQYEQAYIMNTLGIYQFLPYSGLTKAITTKICPFNNLSKLTCSTILFTLYGFDYPQIDFNQFSEQISHAFAGASVKQLLHFGQLIDSCKFRQFDFKETTNLKLYGSKVPPPYPVQNITAPIAIIHTDNDWMSSLSDVKILIRKLKNVVDFYRVPLSDFNHNDYLWGKNAKTLVYDKTVELVNRFNK